METTLISFSTRPATAESCRVDRLLRGELRGYLFSTSAPHVPVPRLPGRAWSVGHTREKEMP
jgi:hypothetical protein